MRTPVLLFTLDIARYTGRLFPHDIIEVRFESASG
jgi:hypothetical protein